MGVQALIKAKDLKAAGIVRLEDKVDYVPNCPECYGETCACCEGPRVIRQAVYVIGGESLTSYSPDDLCFDCRPGGENERVLLPLLISAGVELSKIRFI